MALRLAAGGAEGNRAAAPRTKVDRPEPVRIPFAGPEVSDRPDGEGGISPRPGGPGGWSRGPGGNRYVRRGGEKPGVVRAPMTRHVQVPPGLGRAGEFMPGHQVLHEEQAAHGRDDGYDQDADGRFALEKQLVQQGE